MQELNRRLRGGGNINSTLRERSRGILGSKSFHQVSEDFAAIVIPKVWRREGCKVARVAARLSISPKKVQRILRSQGLLTGVNKTSCQTPVTLPTNKTHLLRDTLSRADLSRWIRRTFPLGSASAGEENDSDEHDCDLRVALETHFSS